MSLELYAAFIAATMPLVLLPGLNTAIAPAGKFFGWIWWTGVVHLIYSCRTRRLRLPPAPLVDKLRHMLAARAATRNYLTAQSISPALPASRGLDEHHDQ